VIRIGVVGYGYWGPNLVRNFAETAGATLAAVADLDARKLEIVKRRYPVVTTTTRFQDLLEDLVGLVWWPQQARMEDRIFQRRSMQGRHVAKCRLCKSS
jgi:hypothetical protein